MSWPEFAAQDQLASSPLVGEVGGAGEPHSTPKIQAHGCSAGQRLALEPSSCSRAFAYEMRRCTTFPGSPTRRSSPSFTIGIPLICQMITTRRRHWDHHTDESLSAPRASRSPRTAIGQQLRSALPSEPPGRDDRQRHGSATLDRRWTFSTSCTEEAGNCIARSALRSPAGASS